MTHRTPRFVRIGLAALPAAALGAAAVVTDTVYAASDAGDCFKPTLDLCVTQLAPAPTTTGDATMKLKCKDPFIIEGAAKAFGYLDQDSGAVGSISVSATSRFWTPTCTDWAYGWSAKGTVVGQIKTRAAKTGSGSAVAVTSFAGSVAGDVAPPAKDSKTAQSTTSGGGGVTVTVGVGPTGPTFATGMSTASQQVSPSTNPAGDSNTLLDGPRVNVGAGSETVVVVALYGYISVQACGMFASWAPHVMKSDATASGYTGAAVVQELYAVGPNGMGYGIGIHPQSGCWTLITRSARDKPWVRGPYQPPVGGANAADAPEVRLVENPAVEPPADGRTPNSDDHGPDGGPLHKK